MRSVSHHRAQHRLLVAAVGQGKLGPAAVGEGLRHGVFIGLRLAVLPFFIEPPDLAHEQNLGHHDPLLQIHV